MTDFRSPYSFYLDVINVWTLCHGTVITQMKDSPSFTKFLKSDYSYLYYSYILETKYSLFILQILVLGYSKLLVLVFFLVSCFLLPSITGLLSCLSFIYGHIHLLSVLGNSHFFLKSIDCCSVYVYISL